MLKTILQLKDKILDNAIIFNIVRSVTGSRDKNLGMIKKTLKPNSNETILDIGCGLGNFSQVAKGPYVGIDANKSFINFAKKNYGTKNKKFMIMDVKKLDFKDKSFDKTLFVSMLHHFSDEENKKVLKEIMRVTKKHLLVVDAIPSKNLLIKFIYGMDRGAYIRPLNRQFSLLKKYFKIENYSISKTTLCVYSIILCKPLR